MTISYESRARKNQLKISEETAGGLEKLFGRCRRSTIDPSSFFRSTIREESAGLSFPGSSLSMPQEIRTFTS